MTYGGFDNHFVFDWIAVPERENIRRKQDRSLALRFVFLFLIFLKYQNRISLIVLFFKYFIISYFY